MPMHVLVCDWTQKSFANVRGKFDSRILSVRESMMHDLVPYKDEKQPTIQLSTQPTTSSQTNTSNASQNSEVTEQQEDKTQQPEENTQQQDNESKMDVDTDDEDEEEKDDAADLTKSKALHTTFLVVCTDQNWVVYQGIVLYGEDHDNFVPVVADLFKKNMNHSTTQLTNAQIRTDGLNVNKKVAEKVLKYLIENGDETVAPPFNKMTPYNIRSWLHQERLLVLCFFMHLCYHLDVFFPVSYFCL